MGRVNRPKSRPRNRQIGLAKGRPRGYIQYFQYFLFGLGAKGRKRIIENKKIEKRGKENRKMGKEKEREKRTIKGEKTSKK